MGPATMFCCIGGGPMLRAKALGIHSAWALRLFEWPVTISVMTVLLAFVCFDFTSGRLAVLLRALLVAR